VAPADEEPARRIAVFAPTTQLSVTIESTAGVEELHVHPAGQGYWVTRMLTILGEPATLCTPVGGETGTVLRTLLDEVHPAGLVDAGAANGGYVHDRRSGERVEVARVRSQPLDRHVVDNLVSTTLAAALAADIVVVCGSNLDGNVEPGVFERVCRDVRPGGAKVVADLAGDELVAALAGGIDLLKLSDEETVAGGWASGTDDDELRAAIGRLRDAGAVDVVISRAARGSIAALDDAWYAVTSPELSAVELRGAGDSMTAALAVGLSRRLDHVELLQLAAAAAALNVTRHGLASGDATAIERFRPLVCVDALAPS
jgi:1-phosphofructokinase